MEEIAPREKSITRDAAAADASARAVLDDMAVSGAPIYRATGIYNVAPEWRKSQRSHLLVAFLSFVQSSSGWTCLFCISYKHLALLILMKS
jgi:hypothetical protein